METRILVAAAAAAFAVQGSARAQTIEVIYTKVTGSSTFVVPGALDLAGNPVVAHWRAIEDLNVRPNGAEWIVKGRTDLGTDLETILVRGAATSGTMFCQEGRPFQGAGAGELYDFFDTPRPASWDSAGNIVFSARAKGGATTDDEKLIRVTGATHTLLLNNGQPALGLTDNPPTASGDETFGNSMGAVHALDSGTGGFVNTPIGNCHSTRYPALFHGNTSFRQSGVSPIGGETWDSFGLDGAGGTPDGLHWYAEGDTENTNTAIDGILVVDDVIVLQEGSPVGTSGLNFGDVFQTTMAPNGTWYARGRDNSGTTAAAPDWAVRNGVVLAKTGDAVGGDTWGDTFFAIAGNAAGDWALSGKTTNANPAMDDVLVHNGVVVAREGDPVDVNGNGMFDDDAFIGRGTNTLAAFAANDLVLTDGGKLYAILQLRNGAGVDLNGAGFGTPDAFVRIVLQPNLLAYCFGDGTTATACPCANTGGTGRGCANSQVGSTGALLAASGTTSPDTIVLAASGMLPSVPHIYLQGDANIAVGVVFGDGVRCADGQLLRLAVKFAVGGAGQFPDTGDPTISARAAALGAPILPGALRYYLVYYRDPDLAFCPDPPGNSWNATNGIRVHWR